MIPKSGNRFSEKIMRKQKARLDFDPIHSNGIKVGSKLLGYLAFPRMRGFHRSSDARAGSIERHNP
jgi:hypothetical protein